LNPALRAISEQMRQGARTEASILRAEAAAQSGPSGSSAEPGSGRRSIWDIHDELVARQVSNLILK